MSGDVQFEGTPEEWKALVEKSIQKKLLTEIMDADAKDGLYSAVSKMETTQTAVEWLINYCERENWSLPSDIEEIAKAMEKEQLIDAYRTGKVNGFDSQISSEFTNITAEQYYNETYNK